MAYKETFWMACDSTEQLRAEYGPFHTREQAELEAKNSVLDISCATSISSAPTKRSRKFAASSSNSPDAAPVGSESYPGHAAYPLRYLWRILRSRQGLAG